ncbi:hypothetical protein [Paractinoplanes rishiriensis]|uniref:Helix-hairpin-helix domain-containing protein n=1 Tax=Paractinoplanes rishiriensis TaxID=1050105 RepID=A0A919JWC6_9ACTN|nr:hypothetical protein [Actinoplanes rishiriensis]GIE94512.1 hypothetical protein Ari01nite_19770 [Actinoplanes rishiriensis]
MTTPAQLRKFARSLAETHQQDNIFAVRDKRFAALGGGNEVTLHLPAADAEDFLAAHPAGRRGARGTVRIGLADLDGQQLNHWVWLAWRSCAPRELTEPPAAAADLPKAIGQPATRALAAAGITTLAQVAGYTDAELLALHGVGPKAIGILRASLIR